MNVVEHFYGSRVHMVNENSRLRLLLLISPWAAISSPKLKSPKWGLESIPGSESGIE
jgi:hypothetical protein